MGETVFTIISDPSVQPFGTEPPVAHRVYCTAANPDNPSILHTNIHPAAIRAENAGGLNPMVRFLSYPLIDSCWPIPNIGCSLTPNISDAIACLFHFNSYLVLV